MSYSIAKCCEKGHYHPVVPHSLMVLSRHFITVSGWICRAAVQMTWLPNLKPPSSDVAVPSTCWRVGQSSWLTLFRPQFCSHSNYPNFYHFLRWRILETLFSDISITLFWSHRTNRGHWGETSSHPPPLEWILIGMWLSSCHWHCVPVSSGSPLLTQLISQTFSFFSLALSPQHRTRQLVTLYWEYYLRLLLNYTYFLCNWVEISLLFKSFS